MANAPQLLYGPSPKPNVCLLFWLQDYEDGELIVPPPPPKHNDFSFDETLNHNDLADRDMMHYKYEVSIL